MAKEKNESINLSMVIKDDAIAPYEIKVDDNCFYVVRVLISKEKQNKVERPVGYFGSLSGALRAITQQKVISSNQETTVAEYINQIKETFDKLTKAIVI